MNKLDKQFALFTAMAVVSFVAHDAMRGALPSEWTLPWLVGYGVMVLIVACLVLLSLL